MKYFWTSFYILCLMFPVFCRQEKKVIREPIRVEVVNVEVPVRVFLRGEPVGSLKKSDFKIFEGGEEQTVHGFFPGRRKIKAVAADPSAGSELPPRHFVLIFEVSEHSRQLDQGIEYLFDRFLTEADDVLIFVNRHTLSYTPLRDKELARAEILNLLKGQAEEARQHMFTYLKTIENEMDRFRNITRWGPSSSPSGYKVQLKNSLEKYLAVLTDYKRKFLTPDMDAYSGFLRHLAGIKKEKWVIQFSQTPLFPTFSLRTRRKIDDAIGELSSSYRAEDIPFANVLKRLMTRIDRSKNMAEDFPGDRLERLFSSTGATFHAIVLPMRKELLLEDLRYEPVSTQIERLMQDICRRTGGLLTLTGDIESALAEIGNREDIYYILTYSPKNRRRAGKIKILPVNSAYEVFYDEDARLRPGERPAEHGPAGPDSAVEIREMVLRDKKLHLLIGGFATGMRGDKTGGRIGIGLVLRTRSGRILYQKCNTLASQQGTVKVSVNFSWLRKGSYKITVRVNDLLSGRSAFRTIEPVVE